MSTIRLGQMAAQLIPMMLGVGGEVDGDDVVAADQSGPWQGVVQVHKQLTKPAHLCHVIGHSALLRLNARTGDDVMSLQGPGDEAITQKARLSPRNTAYPEVDRRV
jgi:hypothetical protein